MHKTTTRKALALACLLLTASLTGCLPDASSLNSGYASTSLAMLTGTAADDVTDLTVRDVTVMVDGSPWATTPQGMLTTGYLAQGRHLVEASAAGYEPFKKVYTLPAGLSSIVIWMTPKATG